ncbi:MAG: hypothetical protein JWO63_875 [Frankiales bacterium]|nr:hypothetical protein [Frankiales bacterium]
MNADELDRAITAALQAQADQVGERDLRPAAFTPPEPTRDSTGRGRWGRPLLAAAVVAAIAIGTILAVEHGRSGRSQPATRPSSSPSVSRLTSPSSAIAPVSPSAPVLPSPYQPLWPFGDGNAARAWQQGAGATGSQPWHLDAGQTALAFTRSYLGFSDIDQVTGVRYDDSGEAHVSVGYLLPDGASKHTAAVLHLLRYGRGAAAPWEVVGSDDTTLSFRTPVYGSRIRPPVTVSGRITGVDEAIRIWIRSLGAARSPVLQTIAAGGQDASWTSTRLPISASGVLTIVIATGGHLKQVEQFAIQGVHT